MPGDLDLEQGAVVAGCPASGTRAARSSPARSGPPPAPARPWAAPRPRMVIRFAILTTVYGLTMSVLASDGMRTCTCARSPGPRATTGRSRTARSTPSGFAFDFEEVPVLVHAFRRMVPRARVRRLRDGGDDLPRREGARGARSRRSRSSWSAASTTARSSADTPAGIARPKDLEGKRVGVNRGYTVTTGVWARGILRDEYGVDLDSITWVLSGDEHVAEYVPPRERRRRSRAGRTLDEMLASGELAAVDRGRGRLPRTPRPLIPDPEEAGFAALPQRGLYPINHLVVVRDDLLAEHPDLAAACSTRSPRPSSSTSSGCAPALPSRPDRPDVRAGDGDHRRRPAAVRHRAQPAVLEELARAARRPAHPRPARRTVDVPLFRARHPTT